MTTPLLKVTDLRAGYGKAEVLHGLSLEAAKGSVITVIGPNGAGKSTCFACIAGQHRLTRGEVLWAGERIDRLDPAQRLARGVAQQTRPVRVSTRRASSARGQPPS